MAKSSGVDHRVEFRMEDATRTSLATATVVILFLTPGTSVITHNYTIPGWMVRGVETSADERERHDLYLYVVGKEL